MPDTLKAYEADKEALQVALSAQPAFVLYEQERRRLLIPRGYISALGRAMQWACEYFTSWTPADTAQPPPIERPPEEAGTKERQETTFYNLTVDVLKKAVDRSRLQYLEKIIANRKKQEGENTQNDEQGNKHRCC